MHPALARRRAAFILAGFFALLVPGSGHALTILESSRSVSIQSAVIDPYGNPIPTGSTETDPVGHGFWSAALADQSVSASQASLIDANELSGSGSVASLWYYELARTRYHVVFAVDADTPYSFGVDNVDSGFASFYGAQGSVALNRVDPGNTSLIIESIYSIELGRNPFTGAGYPDLSEQGTLGPGTYALDYRLQKGGTHNYGDPGAAGFALLVIPEPRPSHLMALGLLGLGLRRRRI